MDLIMTGTLANAVLFCYIAAFFTGVVNITLNVISVVKKKSRSNSRLLQLNITFLIFVLVNFIMFFSRLFVLRVVLHNILLILYDLSYAVLVYLWCSYLGESDGGKLGRRHNIIIGFAVGLYFVIWLATYLLFIDNPKQQIDDDYVRVLTFIAEIIIFVVVQGETWYFFRRSLTHGGLKLLTCLTMSLYFLWFFVYETDCIFYFLGPKQWSIYPFDAIIIIYFVFNILIILRHYSDLWGKDKVGVGFDPVRDAGQLAEEIDAKNELTNREREVLELMIQGKNNAEIAEALIISIYTVKRHTNNIFKKTNLKSRTDLAVLINEHTQR